MKKTKPRPSGAGILCPHIS